MNIDITLTEDMCDAVLERYGYTTEKTLLYYNVYEDYNAEDTDENLRSVEYILAYPEEQRPDELNSKHPMIEDLENFKRETVIERLFNQWLFETMCASDTKRE